MSKIQPAASASSKVLPQLKSRPSGVYSRPGIRPAARETDFDVWTLPITMKVKMPRASSVRNPSAKISRVAFHKSPKLATTAVRSGLQAVPLYLLVATIFVWPSLFDIEIIRDVDGFGIIHRRYGASRGRSDLWNEG